MSGKTKEEQTDTSQFTSIARGLIVINPSAGGGELEQVRAAIRSILDEKQFHQYVIEEGVPLCDILESKLQQNQYEWVAAAGGDGTVTLVGDCLVRLGVPLAIIPAGTGNALANVLGIPEDIEAACRLLLGETSVRQIDAIRVAEQYYFLQVGVGLEAMTMKETPSAQKDKLGEFAYLLTAAKEALDWQPHRFRITVDGEVYMLEASELVVANAAGIGVLGLQWGNSIALDDGLIDLVAILARDAGDYMQVVTSLFQGKQEESEHFTFYQVRNRVRIETEQSLPTHGDGELIDGEWPLVAEVVPAALSVIVPLEK